MERDTMRTVMAVVVCGLLLAGCGGDTPPPEVAIGEVTWEADTVTVTADTNLPDGAVLSWLVVEGDDWDDLEAANTTGFATVDSGVATATADVAGFDADRVQVEVAFLPGYTGQPDGIGYSPDQGVTVEGTVSR